MRLSFLRISALIVFSLFLNCWIISPATAQGIDFPSDSIQVCTDVPVTLQAEPAQAYSWSPAADFDDPTAQTVVLTPSTTQWYFLESTVDSATTVLDSIFVELIDPTFSVTVSTMDTVCPETPIVVTFDASDPVTSVTWNNTDGVEDSEATEGTIIRPLRTTEYIVTAMIGTCERADTFTVVTIPFELNLQTEDTIFICKPDTVVIRTQIIPPDEMITWSPMDETIEIIAGGLNARVSPSVTTVYTASASFQGCFLERRTVVRVDSLPDLEPLTPLPFKDPYCSGDSLWIIGPAVDTALYPDLEWTWMPMDGQIVGPDTPGTTGNVRIMIMDTTTWFRVADNNACTDTTMITLNAVPPDIPLSVNDTSLCPGERFDVEVLDRDVEDLEWSPEEGLSCTMCFEPQVTVLDRPQTYTVMGMKDGCPVSGQLQVNPLPFFPIPVSPNAFACEGEMIDLTIDDSGLTNLRLAVVSGNGELSCNDCPNPTLTINDQGGFIVIQADTDSSACGAYSRIPYGVGALQEISDILFLCPDQPTQFDLSAYGDVIDSDPSGIADCNGTDCTITITEAGGTLTLSSDFGDPGFCGKESTVEFRPYPPDQAMIVPLDSTGFAQGETVEVALEPPGPDGTIYRWFVDGVEQEDTGNPAMITWLTTGNMQTISVSWTNSRGCTQVVQRLFEIDEASIVFPNAFTPGGDNPLFRAMEQGPAELDVLLIFNRWGQLVFESGDPDGWDGTFKGEPAPPEVYVYLAKYRFPNGEIREFKGDVTLIR